MTFATLILGLTLGQTPPGQAPEGYVYQACYELDNVKRGSPELYRPEPGDIVLATTRPFWSRAGHWLAGSGAPHHSGIVVRGLDGKPAILESGPFNTLKVKTLDLMDNLLEHERREETVWIRKRRTPLTEEQSKNLTEWAMAQDGKRFAAFRLVGQLTIFRCRGPLRTWYVGGPHGARDSYYCIELVLESLVHVGAVDREKFRPCATYPRDVFFDRSSIPFINQNSSLAFGWHPPALWTSKQQ